MEKRAPRVKRETVEIRGLGLVGDVSSYCTWSMTSLARQSPHNGCVSTDDKKHVCSRWTRLQREHIWYSNVPQSTVKQVSKVNGRSERPSGLLKTQLSFTRNAPDVKAHRRPHRQTIAQTRSHWRFHSKSNLKGSLKRLLTPSHFGLLSVSLSPVRQKYVYICLHNHIFYALSLRHMHHVFIKVVLRVLLRNIQDF